MSSIDSLFCSQERMAVLRFLVLRSNQYFTTDELTKALSKKMLNNGHTLRELEKLGAVKKLRNSETGDHVFRANKNWLLFEEFRALFVKAQLIIENDIERKLSRFGSVRLFVLTGMFVGDSGAATDVLVVGKINQRALATFMSNFEEEIGQEVNYTVLTLPEFQFRHNVGDRFLHNIIDQKHVVIADYLESAPPIENDLPPSVKLPAVKMATDTPKKEMKKRAVKKAVVKKKTKPVKKSSTKTKKKVKKVKRRR